MAKNLRRTASRRAPRGDRQESVELTRVCASIADGRKAEQIVILDLRGHAYVTDIFVIASCGNPRQMVAVSHAVQEEMRRRGRRTIGVEGGRGDSRWILLDYGDFVVHLFDPEWRKLYDLELLWGDSPRIEWADSARPAARRKAPRA